MAMLTLKSGKHQLIDAEGGSVVWRVMQGEIDAPDAELGALCKQVEKVYLNPENAPESYLEQLEHNTENEQVRLPYVD